MGKEVNGEVWLFYDKQSLKGAAKKKGFHAKLHHIATGKHDMFFSEPKKLRAKPVMIPSMVKIPALEAAEAAAKREESGGAKSGQELKSADESAEQAARADAE